jgi:hypothetical protein
MSQPSSSCVFLRKPRGEVLKKNKYLLTLKF